MSEDGHKSFLDNTHTRCTYNALLILLLSPLHLLKLNEGVWFIQHGAREEK